jgi:hypothetical protein
MAEAAGKIARGELMTPAIELTHEQLRKRAIQWLTNTRHCGVVLSEISCLCSERPDAIGWQHHASYLIECKVSKSDFRAQKDKIHVRAERGVGMFRYYMCPPGVKDATERLLNVSPS